MYLVLYICYKSSANVCILSVLLQKYTLVVEPIYDDIMDQEDKNTMHLVQIVFVFLSSI